jgi:hypothetical protein
MVVNQDVKAFILVKPDGARYLNELESTLEEKHMHIERVYFVADWEKTSRALYKPQLQACSREFLVGFEAHVWLNRHLFGNHSLILVLETNFEDLETSARAVREVRDYFRSKIPHSRDGTFMIALNLNRLDGDVFQGAGITGNLGVLSANGVFTTLGDNYSGRWDDHYFKHIHAPDDLAALIREWKVLLELGIISDDNYVSRQEWNLLKLLRCLTPPSKYQCNGN